VGGGGASGALDRGWEAAEAADDGKPRQRRSSSESTRAEEGRRSNAAWGMGKKKVMRNSWASFQTRGGTARVKQLLASSAARVAARAVEGQGEGQQRPGSGGCGAGGARGAENSGAGQLVLGKMAGEGSGVTGARQSRGRGWKLKTRTDMRFSKKCRDSTVKPKQLLNHCSNENVPKSKSVEISKIYNFALRFSFKRVKDLI
jgi:hypothetical protein